MGEIQRRNKRAAQNEQWCWMGTYLNIGDDPLGGTSVPTRRVCGGLES
jgi:hypothetical protein